MVQSLALLNRFSYGPKPFREQVWFSSKIQDLIFAKKDLFSKIGLAVCLMW
jgi:hypothetical protein